MMQRRGGFGPGASLSDARGVLRRLLGYLRPYRLQLVAIALMVVLFSALNIVGPYLMQRAIDDAILPRDTAMLVRITLLMTANYGVMWLAGVGYGRMMAEVAQKVMYTLRRDLFEHMQTLSLSYYDRQSAGDLMSRLTNDMEAINLLLSQNLVNFMSSLVTMVGVFAAMFLLNAWLALATLIVIPIMFGLVGLIMRKAGPAFRELQGNLGTLNGTMEETLSGQRVMIVYGRQGTAIDEFDAQNAAARDAGMRANVLTGFLIPITMILSNLNVVIVVCVGAFLAISGMAGVTVGMIAAFADYSRRFGQPLMQISQLFNGIVSALAGAERIFQVLDTQPSILNRPNATVLNDVQGEVVFDNVDFGYAPDEPVLRNIDLHAQPGEMIALVGPTGAGKTTIINLLTRFYDINKGHIYIDGNELRDVQQSSLRRQLGIVLQDTYLFADTVMENIRYGNLEATDSMILRAAKLANADNFIRRLPDGYHTVLSERASNLSQGQRQLLAIARAILADPAILILDEATSSVDTRTEMQIQEALLTLMEGRTSFVIAHRLSTIRKADQILVVNDGEIIERGTHESLLAGRGFYYNMYTSQFKGQIDIADLDIPPATVEENEAVGASVQTA